MHLVVCLCTFFCILLHLCILKCNGWWKRYWEPCNKRDCYLLSLPFGICLVNLSCYFRYFLLTIKINNWLVQWHERERSKTTYFLFLTFSLFHCSSLSCLLLFNFGWKKKLKAPSVNNIYHVDWQFFVGTNFCNLMKLIFVILTKIMFRICAMVDHFRDRVNNAILLWG